MSDVRAWLASLSPQKRDYALKHTPSHLAKAGKAKQLHRCLIDFDFIAAKVSALGSEALIEDYDLPVHPDAWSEKKAESLRLIQGALRLSAHVLDQDKTQLVEQLWGRLMCFKSSDIQELLDQARQRKDTPWLRQLTPSFTPPGGRLLRTFSGHTSMVNAVVVTPDSKRVISGSGDTTLKIWDLETKEELFTLKAYTESITAAAVTADGNRCYWKLGIHILEYLVRAS